MTPTPQLLRVALTGGIATGKSYVLSRIAALAVPTIDADRLAHEALGPDSPAHAAVRVRFGPSVVAPDGTIDRRALGAIVFSNPAARADLEAIVHPQVYRAIREWFARLEAGGQASVAVADIPLLFETGHQADFDRVIVTRCSKDEQIRRLKLRDGVSDEEARQRLAAQWPLEEKVSRADIVIDTNGTPAETDRQVGEALAALEASDS